MDRILVAGMGRTGTMLVTKIIEYIIGSKVTHKHYYINGQEKDFDIIISTSRDFREQMASTKRYLLKVSDGYYTYQVETGGRNTLLEECEMAMKIYNDWKPYVKIYLNMEEWFLEPEVYLKKLHSYLDIPLDDNRINHLINKFKGKSVMKDHITKTDDLINYNKTFDETEIKVIEDFFDKNYPDMKDNFLYIERLKKDKR